MNAKRTPPHPTTRRDFLKVTGATLLWTLTPPSRAQAADQPSLRFGLITDCHYADRDPAGSRHYRDSLLKLTHSIDAMNPQNLHFLVELGDFKDQDTPPVEAQTLDYLRRIEAAFKRFNGPRYHVLGNHDMDSLSKTQFLAETQNTGIPRDKTHYSFDVPGLHGIVLDANYRNDGADYDHGDFDWTDANVPPAQLDWLKQDLAAATAPVILFVHQRLDGEGDVFIRNADAVRTVLEQSGKVLAAFQGHHHQGGYTLNNGIHYYTLKAAVEGPGPENNAYAIAELDVAGNITVTGYGKAVTNKLQVAHQ